MLFVHNVQSFYLDRDPVLFGVVIGFLRNGTVGQFPFGQKQALIAEARFLGVDELIARLNEPRRSSVEFQEVDAEDAIYHLNHEWHLLGTYPKNVTVYECPREIYVHNSPGRCGKDCHKAGAGNWKEKVEWMAIIRKGRPGAEAEY